MKHYYITKDENTGKLYFEFKMNIERDTSAGSRIYIGVPLEEIEVLIAQKKRELESQENVPFLQSDVSAKQLEPLPKQEFQLDKPKPPVSCFGFDQSFNTAKRRMQAAVLDLKVLAKLSLDEKSKAL